MCDVMKSFDRSKTFKLARLCALEKPEMCSPAFRNELQSQESAQRSATECDVLFPDKRFYARTRSWQNKPTEIYKLTLRDYNYWFVMALEAELHHGLPARDANRHGPGSP